jgi:hypothetical protein
MTLPWCLVTSTALVLGVFLIATGVSGHEWLLVSLGAGFLGSVPGFTLQAVSTWIRSTPHLTDREENA